MQSNGDRGRTNPAQVALGEGGVGSVTHMPSDPRADGASNDAIVAAVRDQTHLLLGRTIAFTADEWAAPTRLPGWTRSHVAAHLVQGALSLVARCMAEEAGEPQAETPPDPHALEVDALADGLSLQIALDTSAGELDVAMTGLPEWSRIPVSRLYEIVMHTFDLDPTADHLHIDDTIATWLFTFRIERLSTLPGLPSLLLMADEGPTAELGPDGDRAAVMGPTADLLLWLARGIVTRAVAGAVELPHAH